MGDNLGRNWTEPLELMSLQESPESHELLAGLFQFWRQMVWIYPDQNTCPNWTPELGMLEIAEALVYVDGFIKKWRGRDVDITRTAEALEDALLDCEDINDHDRFACFYVSVFTGRKIDFLHLNCSLLLLQIDRAARRILAGDALGSLPYLGDAAMLVAEIRSEVESGLEGERLATHAKKRHARDPRQSEKIFVKSCFEAWQETPSKYKSAAAFARDMLDKCDHLISQKKIEDWVRIWRREETSKPR